ncbi:cupin domain-containing protein [Ornithinibacillus sp. 179-J 7C1 HS]|uniref:cupin domain-containing protein n=1 Tax=Ornithinibacillus sp. 179-J 7C1 HS TaxID=3142384 RepID=UPI00399F4ECE
MYYVPYPYPYPVTFYVPQYYSVRTQPDVFLPDERFFGAWQTQKMKARIPLKDYGPNPFVVDIEAATTQNKHYRTALWTGGHLQVTVMSIDVGGDIGLEVHPNTDQFLRIEQGRGVVRMGNRRDNLTIEKKVKEDSAIMVPAGTWHNVINTGNVPLKLYSIYAPPHHPRGTVHPTKEVALGEEKPE